MTEKEFLLVHTKRVRPNPDRLITLNGQIHPKIIEWIGTGHLMTIEYEHNFHRPRLRINYQPWTTFNLPPGVGNTESLPPRGQSIARPLYVGAEAAAAAER